MRQRRWLRLVDWVSFVVVFIVMVCVIVYTQIGHGISRQSLAQAHTLEDSRVKDDRIPFVQRTTEEQRLISLISLPDLHYHSFSAILHDHLHDISMGTTAGLRARVVISQPDGFKVWAYEADSELAPLVSVSAGWQGMLRMYNVPKNIHTSWQQQGLQTDTVTPVPDTTTIVDGVSYPQTVAINRATTIKDVLSDSPVIVDASFLTQPSNYADGYIPNSALTLSPTVYEGRAVTVMHLDWQQSSMRSQTSSFGAANGGPMILWVDNATGLILRLEVYDAQKLVRWAAFSDIHIDESVSDVDFQSDEAPISTPYRTIDQVIWPNGRPPSAQPAGS